MSLHDRVRKRKFGQDEARVTIVLSTGYDGCFELANIAAFFSSQLLRVQRAASGIARPCGQERWQDDFRKSVNCVSILP